VAPASLALQSAAPIPAAAAPAPHPSRSDAMGDALISPVLLRPPADSVMRATRLFIAAEPVLEAARQHVSLHGGRLEMDGGADGFAVRAADNAPRSQEAAGRFAQATRPLLAAWAAAERAIAVPSRLALSFRVNRAGELRLTLHDERFPVWSPFSGEAGLDRVRPQPALRPLRLAAADAALRRLPPEAAETRRAWQAWRIRVALGGAAAPVGEIVLAADATDALFAAICHVGAAAAIGLADPALTVLGVEVAPAGGASATNAPAAEQLVQDFLGAAAMAAVHPLGRFAEPGLALAARS
jgi:hypothetical protein